MKKILRRYVPELVFDYIEQSNYKNKEHLYIITDLLERIKIYRKNDNNYTHNFIDIPVRYFKDLISSEVSYKEAMDFLQSNNIVECDGKYSKQSGKALGYRYNQKYISKLIEVEITKPTLFKRLTGKINEANTVVEYLAESKGHFLNTFDIDYRRALNFIDNLYNKEVKDAKTQKQIFDCIYRYNAYFMSISCIRDKHLFYRKNDTNGRVDTNLTSLKKELKQFITVPDLRQLDITNSQPLFLGFLIKELKTKISTSNSLSHYSYLCTPKFTLELDKYITWCRIGKFYENFKAEHNLTTKRTIDRAQVKKMTYTILFAPPDAAYAKQANNTFKSIFPYIYKFLCDYKKGQHNRLAIDLQRLESSMCIDIIVPLLNQANIKHYTIHDAWIMDKLDSYKAEQLIKDAFHKKYGVEPKIEPSEIN